MRRFSILHLTARTVVALFVAGVPSVALSDCPDLEKLGSQRRSLSGSISEKNRGIGFEWHSVAVSEDAGYWRIANFICNIGNVNLVAGWPKANMMLSGFNPLMPNTYWRNDYSVSGPAPGVDDDAEITYDFVARRVNASVFLMKEGGGGRRDTLLEGKYLADGQVRTVYLTYALLPDALSENKFMVFSGQKGEDAAGIYFAIDADNSVINQFVDSLNQITPPFFSYGSIGNFVEEFEILPVELRDRKVPFFELNSGGRKEFVVQSKFFADIRAFPAQIASYPAAAK